MTRRIRITSRSNERLKALRRLGRRRAAAFVVEGHRQLRSALAAGAPVVEVYAAPELYLGEEDEALVRRAEAQGARVYELSAAAFLSISGPVRAEGLLAVVAGRSTSLDRLSVAPGALVVVASGIERPGNLGTIVRTACAAGAGALLTCDCGTDVYHPEAVRASVGTLFHLACAEASTTAAVTWLRSLGARIVAATPETDRPYWAADYSGATAVVVGSERHGVADAWLKATDETVSIPMDPGADSLNVAVAAGVVLFEAARQRAAASDREALSGA